MQWFIYFCNARSPIQDIIILYFFKLVLSSSFIHPHHHHIRVYMPWSICESQRTTFWSPFSLSAVESDNQTWDFRIVQWQSYLGLQVCAVSLLFTESSHSPWFGFSNGLKSQRRHFLVSISIVPFVEVTASLQKVLFSLPMQLTLNIWVDLIDHISYIASDIVLQWLHWPHCILTSSFNIYKTVPWNV